MTKQMLSLIFLILVLSIGCTPGDVVTVAVTPDMAIPDNPQPAVTPKVTAPATILNPSPTNTTTVTPTSTGSPEPTATMTPTPPSWQAWFDIVAPISNVFSEQPTRLFMTADGDLMLIAQGVVAQLVNHSWEIVLDQWPGRLMIEAGQIWSYDKETETLYQWHGAEWLSFGPEQGWLVPDEGDSFWIQPGSGVYDFEGRFWLSTNHDVRLLENGRWTIFTSADMGFEIESDPTGATTSTFTILPVPESGEIWIGHCLWIPPGPSNGSRGIRRFDGQNWQTAEPGDGCAIAMALDDWGRVWAGIDEKLWQYDLAARQWQVFGDPPPPFPDDPSGAIYRAVLEVTIDSMGRPWPVYLACGGASCSVGEHRYLLPEAGTFLPFWQPGDEMGMPFLALANGRIFMFRPGGLYEFTDDTVTLLTDQNTIYARDELVVVDENGDVWAISYGEPIMLLKMKDE